MILGAQSDAALALKHKAQDWIGKRKRIDFWLYVDKIYDLEVYAIIEWFKRKGLFRSSAMTGLRVMFAYYHNNIEAIFDELPNLKAMVGQGCNETNELLRQIIANQQIERERGITDATLPETPLAATAKPVLKQVAVSAPVFEDEDDVLPVIATKASSQDCNANFLKGLQTLQ